MKIDYDFTENVSVEIDAGGLSVKDSNDNEIYLKGFNGFELWWEYDENGNEIHSSNSNGYECWWKYDDKGNEIHFKNSDGIEAWYDSKGKEILKKKCPIKTVTIDEKDYLLAPKE